MKRQLTRTKQMNTKLRLKFSKLKKEASDPSLLDKHMNPLAAELFKNEIVNGERQAKGRMYTPAIKDFAIKCNFYSGSGYEIFVQLNQEIQAFCYHRGDPCGTMFPESNLCLGIWSL